MQTNFSKLLLVIATLFTAFLGKSQPGGCTPIANNSCANLQMLTVGANCTTGTTCDGNGAAGSSCLYAGSECAWYGFTATATEMFVNIDVTATSGCHISSNVYESTGSCAGFEISCVSGAPLDDFHALTGLTVGGLYYVQVCYSPGWPCGNNGFAEYCIEVGVPDPPCETCATPCGTASGYPTDPAIQQVVDDCNTSPFSPELQPGSVETFCYNFTATATSVDFNVVITSNCGSGNVTNFSWALYNSPSCGSPIQTGTLPGLTFNGLTVGNNYVFCYTFTVPTTCTHSQHCPFFVGATVPLPVELVSFQANKAGDQRIRTEWITASETNNDYFTIEKTLDGIHFEEVGRVRSAGNSTHLNHYALEDTNPYSGVSYYRLKQTDVDGSETYSNMVSVHNFEMLDQLHIVPNPVEKNGTLNFSASEGGIMAIEIRDVTGSKIVETSVSIQKGENSILLQTQNLQHGVYLVTVEYGREKQTLRFTKR